MARPRKKKRTHAQVLEQKTKPKGRTRTEGPKSMVIRIGAGDVGPGVSQLVQDMRDVLEPETARRLKERRSNRLKDYTAMAGPLGISHLLLFSRSKSGNTNLRLAVSPRGPTLNFRVKSFALVKDVKRSQKRPRGRANDFLSPPLLVMNNFTSTAATEGTKEHLPPHLESLTTNVFQSLFPSISPQSTPVSSIKRVLLLNREALEAQGPEGTSTYSITLRHYAITSKPSGVSSIVNRLGPGVVTAHRRTPRSKGLPNLGRLEDVASYVDEIPGSVSGFTSASDSEIEADEEVEIEPAVTHRLVKDHQRGRSSRSDHASATSQHPGSEKRAIKLVEIGPRLQLRLTKVEEGVCEGKILWHEYIHKSMDEERRVDEIWRSRKEEKQQRRRTQLENVKRKEAASQLLT